MSLTAGTQLGPYEIVSLLGAGGMGEVYKARDHRLGRDVAVKIVGAGRPGDAELLARLEQEARIAASLNHPNIVAVFDVGTHDGAPYVVSELLDGETLRDCLVSGRLPVRKAVEYARDLADGLAAAHGQGIVHRDLKPENVFVTTGGRPKILDFGLAKALSGDQAATATALQTLPGVVMGTVGYMSPEQVAGRAVDHRTDIFSLGIILDEMVTGQRAFKRATAAETMAAIVQHDPPPASSLNPSVPATLDRIINRCLEKSPVARFQSASDLSFALSTATSSSLHSAVTSGGRRQSGRFQIAAVVVLVALLASLITWYAARLVPAPASAGTKHFTIDLQSMTVSESLMPLALSPDGRKLVVSLGSYQGAQLYLRSLDRPGLQLIPGTLDAFNPFFSPDGEWIGFFSSTELKKAPVAGGAVVTIYRTKSPLRGHGTWGANGTIYFTPYVSSALPVGSGVMSVASNGGEITPVTMLAAGEVAHRGAVLLPGERALLFTAVYGDVSGQSGASFKRSTRVMVRSFDTGAQSTLIESASFARYVPSGHIVYVKGEQLLAAPFDVERLALTGPAVVVSDQVEVNTDGSAQLAFSADGTLAYFARTATDRRSLMWIDRRGTVTAVGFGERTFETPRLSPDGTRIATLVRENDQADVWVQERAGALSRLTFEGAQTGLIWTPDGKAITFSTLRDGKGAIVSQGVEGERASRVMYSAGGGVWPGSWSRDGQTLAFMEARQSGDILFRAADGKASPFVDGAATEWGARLSPDDRWMAYTSNESGRWEIYVKPFPGPGQQRQISSGGGAEVVWARNGRELFFRNGSSLMAVPIQLTPDFSYGAPYVVFEGSFVPGQPGLPGYDVSLDGQRFLIAKPGDAEAAQPPIHLVLNWFDEIRRLTAAAR